MSKKDEIDSMFSEMYKDLFGRERLTNKNFEDIKNIYTEMEAMPEIEVPEYDDENTNSIQKNVKKITSNKDLNWHLKRLFEKIENLQITEESKITLKKIVEYAKKYYEGSTKKYIPFNMRIYCDNDEVLYSITDILRDSFLYFEYIKTDNAVESSFYLIEDSDKLAEIYSKNYTMLLFKDVKVLNSKETKMKDKILNVFENSILDNKEKSMTIVVDKNKQIIDDVFSNNPILRDKIFDFEICAKSIDSQMVYKLFTDKLDKNKEKYSEDFEIKLLEYITATFPKTTLSYPEYIDALYERILFNRTGYTFEVKDIPEYEKEKSNKEIFAELNELVGLKNVKQMLKDLVSLMEFKNKTQNKIKIKDTNLHMVFLGNPGTGKTTVARMVAGILYNLKYIDQNKLIEVSAKDLVAEYVGQTAPKTMAVIEKAMGGVLFIDEAYSLASKPGQNNTFNEECIATLIQAMENYRDNLIVIFAGYSKEMQDFLNSNSGIVSRIGYTLEFADYEIDELIIILTSMFAKAGFEIDEKALDKARKIIEEYKDTENFGNARFVRNLYEKTVIKHATNTKNEKDLNILKTITEHDVVADNLLKM